MQGLCGSGFERHRHEWHTLSQPVCPIFAVCCDIGAYRRDGCLRRAAAGLEPIKMVAAIILGRLHPFGHPRRYCVSESKLKDFL